MKTMANTMNAPSHSTRITVTTSSSFGKVSSSVVIHLSKALPSAFDSAGGTLATTTTGVSVRAAIAQQKRTSLPIASGGVIMEPRLLYKLRERKARNATCPVLS